ncbi:MAG: TolB family protein, partial [Gaiellaceae bacterium]
MPVFRAARVLTLTLISLAGVVAASTALAGASSPTARNGLLAYTALLRSEQLFVVSPDGAGVQRISTSDSVESEPVMSPDGRRIAFVSSRDGNDEIYVMN